MIGVVHIYKTAGTTLASALKGSFGARHCDLLPLDPAAPHITVEELRRTMDRWYPRLDSILGHRLRIYSGLEALTGNIRWVTLLRDPIERTASQYQHDLQHDRIEMDFDTWISRDEVRDCQTRFIAGPTADSRAAIDLLERFAFVGRSDRFDESMILMTRALDMPEVSYTPKWVAPSNRIKDQLLSDPDTLAKLASANKQDLVVWRHFVTQLFPRQRRKLGSDLDGALEALRARNQRITPVRQCLSPTYLAYLAKWRLGYRPWARRIARSSRRE
jgi:hypothetical protein